MLREHDWMRGWYLNESRERKRGREEEEVSGGCGCYGVNLRSEMGDSNLLLFSN